MNLIDISYSEPNERQVSLIYKGNNKKNIEIFKSEDPYFLVLSSKKSAVKEISKLKYEFKGKIRKIKHIEPITKIYKGGKKEFLKIMVEFPREVPIVRNQIKELESVEEIFEADIPYVFRTLLDNNMELYKNFEPKIMAFDIETTSRGTFSNPKTDQIISISYYSNEFKKVTIIGDFKPENKYTKVVSDERKLIQDFQKTMDKQDPDIIVGYNSDRFDMPFIKERAELLKIPLKIGPLKAKINNRSIVNEKISKIEGLTHFDVYIFIRNILSPNLKTTSLKLDNVAQELLGEKKTEQIGARVGELWEEGSEKNLKRIVEYNLRDSKITYNLAKKTIPIALQFSKFIGLPLFDTSRMRYGRLVEQFIIRHSIIQNRVILNKASHKEIKERKYTRFEGAFVYQPTPGVYQNIRVFDFRSLYPSIIIAHNIEPDTLKTTGTEEEKIILAEKAVYFSKKHSFIPQLIRELLETRSEIKRKMKNTDKHNQYYKELEAQSYAVKILANASYGYLGFFAARWYNLNCARAITAMGRKYINQVIEIAEKHNIEVIYGDTDSVFLIDSEKIPEFITEVNSNLPNPMELEEEGTYQSGIFLEKKGEQTGAKKRYALLDEEGTLTIKGLESRRGDWSKLAKKTQREVLQLILETGQGNLALEKVKDKIKDIRNKNVDLNELILTNRITKHLHEYKARGPQVVAAELMNAKGLQIGPGTAVSYVISKGASKTIRDRVKLPEDFKMENLDTKYYIENQVLRATYKILELFGYSEEQIKSADSGLGEWM